MRFQHSFFALSIEMVNQRIDCDDIKYMEQDNSAEERQKRPLTTEVGLTGVRDQTTETKRKGDANCGTAD